MTKVTEAEVWADLYHPVEHKILAKYLDWDPVVPVDDVGIYDGTGEDKEYICVEEDAWGGYSDMSLPNAVARIALETADDQPFDWDEMYAEEYAEFHQRIRSKTIRPVTLSPRNLFSVSWAMGGPCCSFETYHVTYILGYRHQVVTVTWDSVDHFRYC